MSGLMLERISPRSTPRATARASSAITRLRSASKASQMSGCSARTSARNTGEVWPTITPRRRNPARKESWAERPSRTASSTAPRWLE